MALGCSEKLVPGNSGTVMVIQPTSQPIKSTTSILSSEFARLFFISLLLNASDFAIQTEEKKKHTQNTLTHDLIFFSSFEKAQQLNSNGMVSTAAENRNKTKKKT